MKKKLLGLSVALVVTCALGTKIFTNADYNLKTDSIPTSESKAILNKNFGSDFKILSGSHASVDKNGNVWAINNNKEVCYNGKAILASISGWTGNLLTSSNEIILTSRYAFFVDPKDEVFVAISLKDPAIQIAEPKTTHLMFPTGTQLIEVGKDASNNHTFYMAIIEGPGGSNYALFDLNDASTDPSTWTLTAKFIDPAIDPTPIFPDADISAKILINTATKFTNNPDDSTKPEANLGNSWIVAYQNKTIDMHIKLAVLSIKLDNDAGELEFNFTASKLKDNNKKPIYINSIINVTSNFYKKNGNNYDIAGFDSNSKFINMEITIPAKYVSTDELSFKTSEIAKDADKNIINVSASSYDNSGDLFFAGKIDGNDSSFFEIQAKGKNVLQITNGVPPTSIFSNLQLDENEASPILHATFGPNENSLSLYDIQITKTTSNNTALVVLGSIFGVVAGLGTTGTIIYYVYNKKNHHKSNSTTGINKK